ncbi:MAG: hypothetical protein AB7T19_08760 [Planctomycetota bacterium]
MPVIDQVGKKGTELAGRRIIANKHQTDEPLQSGEESLVPRAADHMEE